MQPITSASATEITRLTPEHAEEVVRRYYALVDAQDYGAMVQLFAVDATYCRPGYARLSGHGDLRRFYESDRIIVDGLHTLTEVIVDADRVAVTGDFVGTVVSGNHVELRFADFFHLQPDGLVNQRETFFFTPLV